MGLVLFAYQPLGNALILDLSLTTMVSILRWMDSNSRLPISRVALSVSRHFELDVVRCRNENLKISQFDAACVWSMGSSPILPVEFILDNDWT